MLVTLCQSNTEEIRKVASETLLALGEFFLWDCLHGVLSCNRSTVPVGKSHPGPTPGAYQGHGESLASIIPVNVTSLVFFLGDRLSHEAPSWG